MKLTKWSNPSFFPDFDSFLEPFLEGDRNWSSSNQINVPAVNVVETEKGFELDMAIPGKSKEDFEITVDNDMLSISSESEQSSETEEKNYTRKEFSYSSFKRSFRLPENVKSEKIDAKYENGVLKLIIPKSTTIIKESKSIKVA